MPNPPDPDRDDTSDPVGPDSNAFNHDGATERVQAGVTHDEHVVDGDEEATEAYAMPSSGSQSPTEAIAKPPKDEPETTQWRDQRERRFTAPGFDAKETAVIRTAADPATEVFNAPQGAPHPPAPSGRQPRTAMPQLIPPRIGVKLRPSNQRSWGWVLALILIILALAAIAVLGTVLLTRSSKPKASQEDQVRTTIGNFDIALQNGDLAGLRSMTCGSFRDDYESYDQQNWDDTYHRVAAARQYPVVASIDQVVVNGDHAEANVTAFMAYAPQIRSTRSFDLQFRDDQWKICQSSNS